MSDHVTEYTQDTRLLAIDTPLGPDKVLLITLEGEDVLSRCFHYRVTIETEQTDNAVQSLLGMPVTLWLLNDDPDRRRPIHGHVRRLAGQGLTPRGTRLYQLEVVPRLWFLSCTSDCRIFQNQNIPDIIQTIFKEQGLIDFEFRIMRADYQPVEYCVQYQETALDFVSRWLEHLGLFYWHEHSANKHLLVIADRNAAAPMCQPAEVRISPLSGTDALQSLDVECTFRPGKWALNDYDFQSPTKLLRVDAPTMLTVPRMANHEMYEYPGKFLDQDTGKRLSRLRIELEEAQQHRVFGAGRCAGFDPGRRFSVSATRGGRPTTYLLTEVRHHGTAPGAETDGSEANYTNDYVAIPVDLPFRPERLTPKPFVRGTQTATVVGPAGENIYCDQYGRVRVQFHWDRRGQRNDQSSCWMRVAQARSGSNYGTLVIPHVGHEVLVSFIEGDPDRPLIIGTVPNALTMPPVMLPLDKDKTVQRDHGNNKFVMQGKAGKESVSMVSPRAVNMFASGRTARPLSSGNTSTLSFFVDPSNNNSTTSASGSTTYSTDTPTGQTATPGQVVQNASDIASGVAPLFYPIPYYQDQPGLTQLWNEWYGTVQSDIDSGSNISSTTGTYGTQDGSVGDATDTTGSYLNWGSEGRINCLVLYNNNLWVNGNGNTWINGQANTLINGEVTVQVNNNSTTQYGSPTDDVAVKTTIWGSNNTIVGGANSTTVMGDNVTSIAGGNETFVGGLNFSVNLGESLTINILATQSINLLSSTTLNIGFSNTYNDFVLDTTGSKVDNILSRVDNIATHMRQAGIALRTNGSDIKTTGMYLMTSDSAIFT
jgi:type VI secretion system secreted protein VgrG